MDDHVCVVKREVDLGAAVKEVALRDLVEVRSGYSTDNLHKGSKKYKFQLAAPEEHCFSIIFNHKQYIHKSIDFAAPDRNNSDEPTPIRTNLAPNGFLNEEQFVEFCTQLTQREELRFILRMFSTDEIEGWNVKELHQFLTVEQHFSVDQKKAEAILDLYEGTNQGKKEDKVMGVMGLRRLLASRWGNIMKEGHDGVFQDMTLPLNSYLCNSSHNTYLTGLQMKGEATVEGYVAALNRGARLLELDLFDGEAGQPVITHKRTLIQPITLKDTLHAILKRAFVTSEFPVILTLENHVSLPQQKVMADLFQEILGDHLYIPDKDSNKKPLPSPKDLKNKILLRGKKLDSDVDEEEEEEETGTTEIQKSLAIHPSLSALIALPSVKLSSNVYADLKIHPQDGSASLSETKVDTLYEANSPLAAYTAHRFVKSYPKGLRQDSSNMFPMNSWLQGVQAVALNFQTTDEAFDVNQGLFRVNSNCGYVLKPEILLRGIDVRKHLERPKMRFEVGIVSAQYLPKSEPSKDIIDPYVSIQVFGIEKDEWKQKTHTIKDNGKYIFIFIRFNPVWNRDFSTDIYCPEMAIVRFCIKDFDSTSANDFVGEYSIPFTRYSQIRLNTGYRHNPDECASLFIVLVFVCVIVEEAESRLVQSWMSLKRVPNQKEDDRETEK
ncbi:plc-4 [Pristionchus pacificus]|uniref:Phosphoinositide phospholipase C n=1 Tax=Pristionchus pacificus TaxID=54126 RepID=A0A2A6BZ50_PRIPA|nr:plc-4 [Pristionchus pacificus]|eukprot:PDM71053.1 plc-4 [Pristionchus pacificus]